MTTTSAVLQRSLELIQQRGWAADSRSRTGKTSLREAVALAAGENYQAYVDAVNTLTKHLSAGITYWEFGSPSRRRTQQEVIDMLTILIESLKP